jgi:hypothetical protein
LARRRLFYGSLLEYNIADTPDATPPFYHDVLSIIFLFIANDLPTLWAVSGTCRTWRFFSNYLPHWTHYDVDPPYQPRLQYQRFRTEGHTRNLIIQRGIEQEKEYERDERKQCVRTGLWQILHLMWYCMVLVSIYAVCWTIGHSDNLFDTDGEVGAMAFFASLVLMGLFLIPIFMVADDDDKKLNQRRVVLTCGALILTMLLGTPIALIGIRTQVAERLQALPVAEIASVPGYICAVRHMLMWAMLNPAPYVALNAPLNQWIINDTFTNGTRSIYRPESLLSTPFVHLYRWQAIDATDMVESACGEMNGTHVRFDVAVTGPDVELAINTSVELTFRGLFSVRYYPLGSDADISKWFSTSNWLWRERKAFIIRSDKPGRATDAQRRIDHLYWSRNLVIIISACIACVFFLMSCGSGAAQTEKCAAASLIIAAICLNPLIMIAAGVMCFLPLSPQPSWVMCGTSSGVALIFIGLFTAGWIVKILREDHCD